MKQIHVKSEDKTNSRKGIIIYNQVRIWYNN